MSISVLMSVYKSEKPAYLDRAIQSVWDDQTLKPDEIILVEDGPLNDGLYIVIDKWKKKVGDNFRILINSQNLGLTKSLNKGLKIAHCEFIARMDSDDISMPTRFEIQSKFLSEHSEVSVVGGFLQEFDESNDCLNVRKYPLNNQDILKYICKASPLAHPTVMMRKSIFKEGLSYNEKYRTSQDIALWFDALNNGYQIANVNEVTIKFRRGDDVYKRRNRSKASNEFKIYMAGIRKLYGLFAWQYCYPIMRYIFRMMPTFMIKFIYGSRLRKGILS